MAENKGLLTLAKNKLTEAEMRQGCTDQTPYAQELIKEFLAEIREVVEGVELTDEEHFNLHVATPYKLISKEMNAHLRGLSEGCQAIKQAILKELDAITRS